MVTIALIHVLQVGPLLQHLVSLVAPFCVDQCQSDWVGSDFLHQSQLLMNVHCEEKIASRGPPLCTFVQQRLHSARTFPYMGHSDLFQPPHQNLHRNLQSLQWLCSRPCSCWPSKDERQLRWRASWRREGLFYQRKTDFTKM